MTGGSQSYSKRKMTVNRLGEANLQIKSNYVCKTDTKTLCGSLFYSFLMCCCKEAMEVIRFFFWRTRFQSPCSPKRGCTSLDGYIRKASGVKTSQIKFVELPTVVTPYE